MTRTPCEQHQWSIIPSIRRELAICLVEVFELTQSEAARKMDVTPAAISQYLNGKRGNGVVDKGIRYEVAYSADIINKNGKIAVQTELCRLCALVRENNVKRKETLQK